MSVGVSTSDLSSSPGGGRERQLVFGQIFQVLEIRDGHAFGFTDHDGYCGYVASADLRLDRGATHCVSAIRSYALPSSDMTAGRPSLWLSFGSRVHVTETEGKWSRIGAGPWMPSRHLSVLPGYGSDPVEVAKKFLGTPYLWGGNSAFGLDCSGLVQAAFLACGIACPGDSDQQADSVGEELAPDTPPERGDLLFWPGHVALMVNENTLIHASAHAMAVTLEDRKTVVERIRDQDGSKVSAHKRLPTVRRTG